MLSSLIPSISRVRTDKVGKTIHAVTIKCKKCGDEAYLTNLRPAAKDLKEIKYCVRCGSEDIVVSDES